MEEAYPKQFKNVIADAGYESEENYVYLHENGYTSYIKPQNHEQMKSGRKNGKIGKAENMAYDPEQDTYTCKIGRKLRPVGKAKITSKSGYVVELT